VDLQTKEDKWDKMCEEASALYDEKTGEMGRVVDNRSKLYDWLRLQKQRKNIPPYQIEKLQKLGILKKDE
jgi:hypothetical protein